MRGRRMDGWVEKTSHSFLTWYLKKKKIGTCPHPASKDCINDGLIFQLSSQEYKTGRCVCVWTQDSQKRHPGPLPIPVWT